MGGMMSKAEQKETEEWLKAKQKEKEHWLKEVAKNGTFLVHASRELRADREVVMKAVASHGLALEYASRELRADREVVMKAVAEHGGALEHASRDLRSDREVVMKAVAKNGLALEDASRELRADREVVMKAVAKNGRALKHASRELRADREVVMKAVAEDCYSLEHASRDLRADREVVVKAVAQSGYALRYASEELRADREVALQAARAGGFMAWYGLAEDLKQDPDIVRAAEAADGGLTSAKRITFGGRLPKTMGGSCVASFPGKFAEKWDDLTTKRTDLAVACVFLTRPEDGLGQHSAKCMCHKLYPEVPPESYVRIMDKPKSNEEENKYEGKLAFSKADAEAMGQVLIEEVAFPTKEAWEKAKKEARKEAKRRWEANSRRPPWGCKWFDIWTDNIEVARSLNQELLVYYFPKQVGKGKVAWKDLNNKDIVEKALEDNGLGASQRAEVAWLEFKGYPYKPLDVAGF